MIFSEKLMNKLLANSSSIMKAQKSRVQEKIDSATNVVKSTYKQYIATCAKVVENLEKIYPGIAVDESFEPTMMDVFVKNRQQFLYRGQVFAYAAPVLMDLIKDRYEVERQGVTPESNDFVDLDQQVTLVYLFQGEKLAKALKEANGREPFKLPVTTIVEYVNAFTKMIPELVPDTARVEEIYEKAAVDAIKTGSSFDPKEALQAACEKVFLDKTKKLIGELRQGISDKIIGVETNDMVSILKAFNAYVELPHRMYQVMRDAGHALINAVALFHKGGQSIADVDKTNLLKKIVDNVEHRGRLYHQFESAGSVSELEELLGNDRRDIGHDASYTNC